MIIETDLGINNSNVKQLVIYGFYTLHIPKGSIGIGASLADVVGKGGLR